MIIIKIGGDNNINFDYVAEDIYWLWKKERRKIIVIHGASKHRNQLAKKLGIPIRKIVSPSKVESYLTDANFLDVCLMAYAGLVNKKLAASLIKAGLKKTIGLTGIDGELFLSKQKEFVYAVEDKKVKLIRGDLSGKIYKINVSLIDMLLKNDYLPVMTIPAIGDNGKILNVDNDSVIYALMENYPVKEIISLIGVPGFLTNPSDETTVISKINAKEIDNYLSFTQGTMKKKMIMAKRYFDLGLERMYLGDGRIRYPLRSLIQEKKGTVITQ
jgi:acetylglutamate/LysW-gamma-L-alpha-aminoadipate kinase